MRNLTAFLPSEHRVASRSRAAIFKGIFLDAGEIRCRRIGVAADDYSDRTEASNVGEIGSVVVIDGVARD